MCKVIRFLPSVVALAAVSASLAWAPPKAPAYRDHSRLMVVRDAAGALVKVESPRDWNIRREHILAHVQEVMGSFPGGERRVPLDVRIESTFDEDGYVRKKLTYASEPADRVPAWLLVPKAAGAKPAPAVLCPHETIAIGKDEPAGLGGKPSLAIGKELAKRGYVVLCPDYPNFGEHKADVYELGYESASMKAIWDNLRGVDLLESLAEVDASRIGAIGHSLGGHNAIFTALFEPRIKVVVSSCGYNAFKHYYKGDISGWSHGGYMPRLRSAYQLDLAKVPFDFPELIGALAPRPFFTNAPLEDANFAVQGVKVCIESAKPVYDLMHAADRLVAAYPDAGHDFPDAVREQAYMFLDRFLKAEP